MSPSMKFDWHDFHQRLLHMGMIALCAIVVSLNMILDGLQTGQVSEATIKMVISYGIVYFLKRLITDSTNAQNQIQDPTTQTPQA